MRKDLQCKDIPNLPILKHLKEHGPGCSWKKEWESSVALAMPEHIPPKLVRAKMKYLTYRGLIDGCNCGCWGDFRLTSKGEEELDRLVALEQEAVQCHGEVELQ